MKAIDRYLNQKNQRFVCEDCARTKEITVSLGNWQGEPASPEELEELKEHAKEEAKYLVDLYQKYNGLQFQINGDTAGLDVASVDQLPEYNSDWKKWFSELSEDELEDFERDGYAFAQIFQSGNYFIMYGGKVYYSDHDGGDDQVWGESLEAFFEKALSDPVQFLEDAGCYTRYFDGKSDIQYIAKEFLVDE